MFLLLIAADAIYLLLGDVGDALMLLGFVCRVMAIAIYQEHKTERVPEALRDLTSPRALTFSTLVIGNLGLLLVNRSRQHTILGTFGSRNHHAVVSSGRRLRLPPVGADPALSARRAPFFGVISPQQFALSVAAGLCGVFWFELFKLVRWRPGNPSG